jgi:predicted  nucleic acid-binding Zn-ribbon protein
MAKPNYAALLASIAQKDREIKTLTQEISTLDTEIAIIESEINDPTKSISEKNAKTVEKNTKVATKTTKTATKATKEEEKTTDTAACYNFPEPITKEEENLFNYVSEEYIIDNPGAVSSYVGKYYGENGELQ